MLTFHKKGWRNLSAVTRFNINAIPNSLACSLSSRLIVSKPTVAFGKTDLKSEVNSNPELSKSSTITISI